MALIYVVEDDKNIMEIESYALKNAGYEVQGYGNAKDFFKAMDQIRPDLVLLDLMLPDEDGLDMVQKLRRHGETRNVPVIMVTAKTTELDKVKGLDAGADDYLTKPFGVMELISRVKALLRRSSGSHFEPKLTLGGIAMDEERHEVTANGELIELTYKEYELLRVLLANVGRAVSRETLMLKIWGTSFEGESRTLDVHIKTLRQKLKEEGAHIKTVRNVGYRIE